MTLRVLGGGSATGVDTATMNAAIDSAFGGTTPPTIYVAASNATAAQKARAGATYTCDGTADEVQIQAALDAVLANSVSGGRVQLSPGTFTIAAPIRLEGQDDVTLRRRIQLYGSGLGTTRLTANNLVGIINLSKVVQADVADMMLLCNGTTEGITATATMTAGASYLSFMVSTFRNLRFEGTSNGSSTGWAMNLENPFRSLFQNIEVSGITNGLRFYASGTSFNPGNCLVERCFVLTYGTNGFAYKCESTASGASGKMNLMHFLLCEGYAGGSSGGSGNTGFYFGGTGEVNSCRVETANMENYDTVVEFNRGKGNVVDLTYSTTRPGATTSGTIWKFTANAVGNRGVGPSSHYANHAHLLITSAATDTAQPNVVERARLVSDTSGAVTNSITGSAGAIISRAITATGNGSAAASTVVVAPNSNSDAQLLARANHTGTQAPSTLTSLPYTASIPWTVPPNAASASGSAAFSAGEVMQGHYQTDNTVTGTYVEWSVWLAAGTYALDTWYAKGSTHGITRFILNGTDLTTVDGYNATFLVNQRSGLTGITIATSGVQTLRYQADTKNASSTGYRTVIHAVGFARTGA